MDNVAETPTCTRALDPSTIMEMPTFEAFWGAGAAPKKMPGLGDKVWRFDELEGRWEGGYEVVNVHNRTMDLNGRSEFKGVARDDVLIDAFLSAANQHVHQQRPTSTTAPPPPNGKPRKLHSSTIMDMPFFEAWAAELNDQENWRAAREYFNEENALITFLSEAAASTIQRVYRGYRARRNRRIHLICTNCDNPGKIVNQTIPVSTLETMRCTYCGCYHEPETLFHACVPGCNHCASIHTMENARATMLRIMAQQTH